MVEKQKQVLLSWAVSPRQYQVDQNDRHFYKLKYNNQMSKVSKFA